MKITTIAVLAVMSLAACAPDASTAPHGMPQTPSFARKPRPAAAEAAPLAIAPTDVTIAVGDTVTFTSTYDTAKPLEFSTFYWGCAPYSECWDVVFIVPRADLDNTAATVVGVAPGTVQVYVADGLGLWSYATVAVTP